MILNISLLCIFSLENGKEFHGDLGDKACPLDCGAFDGEHCEEGEKKCKCGTGKSCIGTETPFCVKGQCKRKFYNVVYC